MNSVLELVCELLGSWELKAATEVKLHRLEVLFFGGFRAQRVRQFV